MDKELKKKKIRKIEADLGIAAIIVVVLISVGAVFYHWNDHLSWVNAFYMTAMTVLTVGYGDYTPTNNLSKVVTIIYSLLSIPIILFALGIIVEDFIEDRIENIENRLNKVLLDEEKILRKEK